MQPPLRVAVAGLGSVGSAVVDMLAERAKSGPTSAPQIELVAVSSRDRAKAARFGLDRWTDDPVAMARRTDIDCFVELIGGDGVARDATVAALDAKHAVVTANKAMLAHHGMALAAKAEAVGVPLRFEASVAGGVPIIKTLRDAFPGNRIRRVYGILNGTCNYILSRMELEKLSFADCLREAQKLGYAEADPTFDIGGFDTAHKLAILTSLAFGTATDAEAVTVEGIEAIRLEDLEAADDLGYRVKLLGVAQRTASGIEQRVHPTMVPKGSAIAQIMGVTNAVVINGDALPELTLAGPGAGGTATASAVVADIVDIALGDRRPPFGVPVSRLASADRALIETHEGGYYVRLSLYDRPGAAAAVAMLLAERGISLESIVQRRRPASRGGSTDTPVPVTLVTHATTERAIRDAVAAVASNGNTAEVPQVIRIERE